MAPKCWSLGNFTSDSGDCQADELLCKEGSHSALCGSCADEYYFSATSRTCESCSGGSMVNMWIFAAVVTTILTFYLAMRNGYVVVPEWISNMWIVGMVSNIDSGCFKVLFSSYQIIQSVSFTMNVVFPWPFSGLLNFLSFISFDISTLDCLPFGGERVHSAVYVYSITPMILALLIIIVGAIRAYHLLPVTHRAQVISDFPHYFA